MQRKNKAVLGAAGLTIGALALTGCLGGGGAGGSSGSGDEDAVIRIASAETAESAIDAIQAAGDRYTEETGVEVIVEAVPLTDVYTKVNGVYGTNAAYSAVMTGFAGHVQLFQAEDKVVPLDDVIEDVGGAEDFYDGDVLFPIDGKTYWMPYDYNNAYGMIRSDWLGQVGMDVPTTWEELLAVAKAFDEQIDGATGLMMPLKADDSANWITSQVLWSNEVRIFDDEWNVIIDEGENGERTTEALAFLAELYQYMPERASNASYGEMLETFIGEQVGMTFYSGRIVDNAIAQNPDIVEHIEIFGFPMRDGDGVTAGKGYDGIAVLNTDHADQTKDFVKWWFQNGLTELYASAPFNYQPAQKSYWEREDWRSLPTIEQYGEQLMDPLQQFVGNEHVHSIDSDGPESDARPGQVFQSMLFPQAYQKVTIGGEDPAQVTAWLGDEIRKLVE